MSPPTHIRNETQTKLHTTTAENVDTSQLASPATVPESGHSQVSAHLPLLVPTLNQSPSPLLFPVLPYYHSTLVFFST